MSQHHPQPPTAYATLGNRFVGAAVDGLLNLLFVGPAYGLQIAATSDPYSVNTGLLIGALVLWVLYFGWWFYQRIYCVGVHGQAIGHKVAGIAVVDMDTGRPVGMGRAILRNVVLALTATCCGIMALISALVSNSHPRRQMWHDSVAGTVAVRADSLGGAPAAKAPAEGVLPVVLPGTPPSAPAGHVLPPLPTRPGTDLTSNPGTPPLAAPQAKDRLPAPPVRPAAAPVSPAVPTPLPQPPVTPPLTPPSTPPTGGLITSVPGFSAPSTPGTPQPAVQPPVPQRPASEVDARTQLRPRRAKQPAWRLRSDSGQVIEVFGTVLVGRDPSADGHPGATLVPVDDPERSMSKTHARFTLVGIEVEVEDLHSTNGTYLVRDGNESELTEPTVLAAGDQIALGDRIFTLEPSE
ncbi:MAG: RDD family protein [Aeromicrobium sp.]|uniref:RDD family protein n=1 Tax=Aeromicrobium sp. TaxID=1871063 RepID=UPI0039E3AE5E